MNAVIKIVRFSSVSWCLALSTILVVTLILGPIAFSGDALAADHDNSSLVSHHDDPAEDDHSDGDLALTHCGTPSCSPSNVNASSRALGPTRVSAEKDGREMVVRGEVQFPRTKSHGLFTGHVDIIAKLPGGQVLERHNVDVRRKRIPKTYGRIANFVGRLPAVPVKGTVVRLSYNMGTNHETD